MRIRSTTGIGRDLTKTKRNQVLATRVPTIEVEGDLADVIDLFVRINANWQENSRAQERRHAHFHKSPTLKTAQRLADGFEELFKRNRIMSAAQIQRMKHVEIFTELILSACRWRRAA